MELEHDLAELSEDIKRKKSDVTNEEATKTTFIDPFLECLGYDTREPKIVKKEYTADFGEKKEEKVDYAIMHNGKPFLLIEAKHHNEKLSKHERQLADYFNRVSKDKGLLGLLTNGIEYRFYSDIDTEHKMDNKPFLTINLDKKIKEIDIKRLSAFKNFDLKRILSSVENLRKIENIKTAIYNELSNPSDGFISLLVKNHNLVKGNFGPKRKKEYTEYFKEGLKDFSYSSANKGKIVTTTDEIIAYQVVQSILHPKTINYKDYVNFFKIFVGESIRRSNQNEICRLWLEGQKKWIQVFGNDPKEIGSIQDINNFKEQLVARCKHITQS